MKQEERDAIRRSARIFGVTLPTAQLPLATETNADIEFVSDTVRRFRNYTDGWIVRKCGWQGGQPATSIRAAD